MADKPKVLILTLYSGEQELDQCVRALDAQTYEQWSHKIFRNLPNVEAHRRLYTRIMESADEFELFVKLDADMVLNRPTALADIVEEFKRNTELDHAVFSLHDWASEQDIMGLHVYSSRVRWQERDESLFVDPNPDISGLRKLFRDHPAPIAEHMPNPSLEQAYLFGFHRALKVVQRDRLQKNKSQAKRQLALLLNIWEAYNSSRDLHRAAVLWGAEEVFGGKDKRIFDKSRAHKKNNANQFQLLRKEHIYAELRKHWEMRQWVASWGRWRWILLPSWLRFPIAVTARIHSGIKARVYPLGRTK